jgi:hypothetical protein
MHTLLLLLLLLLLLVLLPSWRLQGLRQLLLCLLLPLLLLLCLLLLLLHLVQQHEVSLMILLTHTRTANNSISIRNSIPGRRQLLLLWWTVNLHGLRP